MKPGEHKTVQARILAYAEAEGALLEHATSITRLNRLLRDDYRGIIVTMILKFGYREVRPHRCGKFIWLTGVSFQF
jgi:hypothetical protein